MEKENHVSIWFGNCNSINELEQYVEVKYTEDGDRVRPAFESDYGLEYYDEDFREINHLATPSDTISQILEGHSSYKSITDNLIKVMGDKTAVEYNSVILLYEYEYEGSCDIDQSSYGNFKFISTVLYDPDEY